MSANGMSSQPRVPRYTLTEIPGDRGTNVLRIEGEGRNTVFVVPTPTCLVVRYRDEAGRWFARPYGFFDYYAFSGDVARGLVCGWAPPEGRPGWPGVRAWVWRQAGRGIGKRLHAFYKRCLRDADPTVLALQRAVFAATFSAPEMVLREELYEHRYVVEDLIQHRAAAHALANLGGFRRLKRQKARLAAEEEIMNSGARATLEKLAESMGAELSVYVRPKGGYRSDRLSADEVLGMMEGWRGLFSPTGTPYRSLDRTLMNLPGGVPSSLTAYLSLVHLERPVLSRAELVVLTAHERLRLDRGSPQRNERVFRNASEDRVARATRLVAGHTRNPLSTRRARDLAFMVSFLMDYPEDHEGNIVGLAAKSIEWHRRGQEQEAERILNELGRDRSTAAPPIPLPQDPNVRFLSTAREVCEEGTQMNNCVASYAGRAARGSCYLFHVSHAGAEATVEVDRAGRVVQAAGPGNEANAASRWGRRELSRWARGFPEGYEATAPPVVEDEDFYDDIPF